MRILPRCRRGTWLLAAATSVGLVIALPIVHVPVIGWARGEPFYQGWPASYWSREIADADAEFLPLLLCGNGWTNRPFPPPMIKLKPKSSSINKLVRWLAETLGIPGLNPKQLVQFDNSDITALPILIALLDDPNPRVRFFAIVSLDDMGVSSRPALPKLKAMRSDEGTIRIERPFREPLDERVKDAAEYLIYMLESRGGRDVD
jgi:hypothetical protein